MAAQWVTNVTAYVKRVLSPPQKSLSWW